MKTICYKTTECTRHFITETVYVSYAKYKMFNSWKNLCKQLRNSLKKKTQRARQVRIVFFRFAGVGIPHVHHNFPVIFQMKKKNIGQIIYSCTGSIVIPSKFSKLLKSKL